MSTGTGQKSGLTAASVKRAKTKNKPYKLSDRDGLYLLVQPNGKRFWRMNYRFHGKQKTMAFGRWPEVLLGSARERLPKIALFRDIGKAILLQGRRTAK